MSTLLAAGHTDARRYPLCVLFEEARIVTRRKNAELKTEAILHIQAIGSQWSEEAIEGFNRIIKKLES